MKKLIIICEGQTEQEFCNKILRDHFLAKNIDIDYPIIVHSGGGIVKWNHLTSQISLHHRTDSNAWITTFIDYYGIEAHHNFPDWHQAHQESDKSKRMGILEMGMLNSLDIKVSQKFIPNIQLHEFEALLLSDINAYNLHYSSKEIRDMASLTNLCSCPPESINNGRTTAPSKRLEACVSTYDKVIDGPELAKLIGLSTIRQKCPRFDEWISKLERI